MEINDFSKKEILEKKKFYPYHFRGQYLQTLKRYVNNVSIFFFPFQSIFRLFMFFFIFSGPGFFSMILGDQIRGAR